MRRNITIAIILMAALFVPLWAQTAANFSVTRTEDGRGIRISGYTGTVLTVVIPATIQGLPVTEIQNIAHPMDMTANNNITTITIPASVTSISSGAFRECHRLTSITVDGNNPNYSSENGLLYNKEKTILLAVPPAISGTVSIAESVTDIGGGFGNTFSGCTSITTLTIPASVTIIGPWAFIGWTNTQTIIVKGHANQESADAAWGSYTWREFSNARIVYQGQ